MKIEKEVNRDGSAYWLASGSTGGVRYLAEGATRHDAFRAALELVYQRHAARTAAEKKQWHC